MRKNKNFSKIADVLTVRNMIPLEVKFSHDRELYLQV